MNIKKVSRGKFVLNSTLILLFLLSSIFSIGTAKDNKSGKIILTSKNILIPEVQTSLNPTPPPWSDNCARSYPAACLQAVLNVSELPPAWQSAAISAAQSWNQVGTKFHFVIGTFTDQQRAIDMDNWPNTFAIGEVRVALRSSGPSGWGESDSPAITYTYPATAPDPQVGAIIVINDLDFTFSTNNNPVPGQHDFQTTMTHELGHVVGLPHNLIDPTTIMFKYQYPGKIKRTLTETDKSWVVNLYGPISPLPFPDIPVLQSPFNGQVLTNLRPTFLWQASQGANSYFFQLSDNIQFTNPLINLQLTSTTFTPSTDLAVGKDYYWQVKASNFGFNSGWSNVNKITVTSAPPPPPPPSNDTTPPTANGYAASVSAGNATLIPSGVQDNSGGSGVREVRYSAKFNNQWVGIGTASNSPYSFTWNMCSSGVPDGDVELGMEIWDNAGNVWIWSQHYPNPHITKSYNCTPPSYQDGVYLYQNTGLGGSVCYITQDAPSIGNACGSGWNDNTESVRVTGPYYFALYWDDNYGGDQPYSGNPTGDLPSNWRNQASSIRVRRNSPAAFTLYDLGDYNGENFASDRTIFDLGHWNWNDKAESLRVYSGYGVVVCEHSDFHGVCNKGTGPAEWSDINALAQGLRNNVSSVRVCSGTCPDPGNSPTPIYPANNSTIFPNGPITLQWSGDVSQFYVELSGGGLSSTMTYGWTNEVQWNVGALPVSSNPYTWRVKGWRGYGDTGWTGSTFFVQNTDTIPPQGTMTNPARASFIAGPNITLEATVTDQGSGVKQVDFFGYVDGQWNYVGSDTTSPYQFIINANNYSEGFYWFSADAVDFAGNRSGLFWGDTGWTYFTIDRTAPTSAVNLLPSNSRNPFLVSWSGNDSATPNDLNFDIQYQVGCSGNWTNWLSQTKTTLAYFTGDGGQKYCFRSRSTDLAGNIESWPGGADTFTTITSDEKKLYLPSIINGTGSTPPPVQPKMTRVSVSSSGVEGNNSGIFPSPNATGQQASSDGRYYVFVSGSNNLVPDDTNNVMDVFFHDLQTHETTRISVATNGTQANGASDEPAISGDGRFIVYVSQATNLYTGFSNAGWKSFIYDRTTKETIGISSGLSHSPAISSDGRYVALEIVPHVYLYDRVAKKITIVSKTTNGVLGNAGSFQATISGDGRYIVFASNAENLVPDDTNGVQDIFLHDSTTGITTRESVSTDGVQGNNHSSLPSISADGKFIAFQSLATTFNSADNNVFSDIYLRDLSTKTTKCISIDKTGKVGNNHSGDPSISYEGRFVVFESFANNLLADDTNNQYDVIVYDTQTDQFIPISVGLNVTQANGISGEPSISSNGYILFSSKANNLVQNDNNGMDDIFVYGPFY